MRRVFGRAAAIGAAAAVVGVGVSLFGVSAASASTLGGTATIETANLSAPLSGQQASTQSFGISLPAGAACSGDSQNNGFRVVSYLVPKSVYPTLVASATFTGGSPNLGLGYFSAAGTLLAAQNTAPTTGQILTNVEGPFAWGPGAIPGDGITVTGTVSSPFQSALIPTGQSNQLWESGIACINSSGTITDYWNAEITFNTSTTDANGYTWTPTTGTGALVPEAPLAAALPIGGAVVLGGAVFLNRRRRRGSSTHDAVTVA